MHALNSMLNALSQMLDKTDAGGTMTKGFFNSLATVLGENSFEDANKGSRWDHFTASDSIVAAEFQSEFVRQKGLNDELRRAIIDTSGDALPEVLVAGVLDGLVSSLGVGVKKVQKAVMEERERLRFALVHLRMCKLSREDPRRKSWLEQHADSFATQLMSGLPVASAPLTSTRWRVAVQRAFGVPLTVLRNLIGAPIKSGSANTTYVDAYGNNLLGLPQAKGGGTAHLHNNIISAVYHSLMRAGIPTKATNVNGGCKNLFQRHLRGPGAAALTPDDHDVINGIIPDMIIDATNTPQTGSLGSHLGGATHLADLKTCAAITRYNNASEIPGGIIKTREYEVWLAYTKAAKKLGARIHGTPANEIGPIEQELREYGHNGRVLGPIIGCYGGGSPDLGKLRDLAATELARKHVEHHSMGHPQALGMFKRLLNREWGHHMARGWASLLLDRLRDFVGSSEVDYPQPDAHHFGPDSAAAHAQWAHTNGHQGTNNNSHGRRA